MNKHAGFVVLTCAVGRNWHAVPGAADTSLLLLLSLAPSQHHQENVQHTLSISHNTGKILRSEEKYANTQASADLCSTFQNPRL